MMISTLYVLFEEDVRILLLPKEYDGFMQGLVSASFVLFLFEFTLNIWAKSSYPQFGRCTKEAPSGYVFSFFFWLDLLAILSLVPDVYWIAKPLGVDGISGAGVNSSDQFGQIGTEAGKVLRMVRLVRLVKLYKVAVIRARERKVIRELDELVKDGLMDPQDALRRITGRSKESKVGEELSETVMRRVIIGVFSMLCIVPLLTVTDVNGVEEVAVQSIHSLNLEAETFTRETAINQTLKYLDTYPNGQERLLHLYLTPPSTIYKDIDYATYRDGRVSLFLISEL